MSGPTGDVHGTGDFDMKSFIMDIPPVTRTLFIAMFSCTVLTGLKLFPIQPFALLWIRVVEAMQVWRIPLSFLHMGSLGVGFLIRMYFLYTYSRQLESGVFFGRPANYAWFLTTVGFFVSVISILIPSYFNGSALLTAIIHLWGKHATSVTVSLYGFLSIPAKYLSLSMIFIDLIRTGSIPYTDVFGLLGGHIYYFLDSVYPGMPGGRQVISVPIWFENAIDFLQRTLGSVTGLQRGPPAPISQPSRSTGSYTSNVSGRWNSGGAASGPRAGVTNPVSRGGHNWGTGHTLGSL
ncbi:unnamed protein product [Agarophyton chilense]